MGQAAVTPQLCEAIASSEVRRFRGTLPGYGVDDLMQEARIAIHIALRKCDPKKHPKTYLRRAARNRLSNLLRSATTYGRCPHDAYGRPKLTLLDYDATLPAAAADAPDQQALVRQEVSFLRDRLDPKEWDLLVAAFADGAEAVRRDDEQQLETVRQKASSILTRLHYRVSNESEDPIMARTPNPEDMVECHADGDAPQGYDVGDEDCIMCPDKFSCFPRAIEKKLTAAELSADREVEAVERGLVPPKEMIHRMKERNALLKAGQAIPAELRHDYPGLVEDLQTPDDAEPEEEPEEEAAPPPAEPAPKAKEKKQQKKQKPPAKPKAKEAPKAPAKAPAKATKPKPSAKEKAPAPKAVAMTAVAKQTADGLVYEVSVDGRKGFEVLETGEGWGWWSSNGKAESADWLKSYSGAMGDLAKHIEAHAKAGTVLERDESTKKKPKAPKAAKQAKKPKTSNEPKGTPGRPSPVPEDWPRMRDGRIYPQPMELTEEEMLSKVTEAQRKLGCNVQLEIGYRIVRRLRDGTEVVAVIEPNGFRYELPEDLAKQAGLERSQLFGSLSSVAQWADGRLRTGNDYFNIAKHGCTEIRDDKRRIIDRRGGVPEWVD